MSKPNKHVSHDPPAADASVEELRCSIARKLAMFASDWRRCPRRACRRHRGCRPRGIECFAPRPEPRPMTAEQEAEMKAALRRALNRRRAEIARERKR